MESRRGSFGRRFAWRISLRRQWETVALRPLMKIAIVTGSCGLVGSETCKRLHAEGMAVVGVDNDMRRYFFGDEASTDKTRHELRSKLQIYVHEDLDIRDWSTVDGLFKKYGFA